MRKANEQRAPGEILEEIDSDVSYLRWHMPLATLFFVISVCVWIAFVRGIEKNLDEIGNGEGIINGSLESDIRAEAYEQGWKAGRRSKEEPEATTERSRKATGESAEA
jgi:hypothetical protein